LPKIRIAGTTFSILLKVLTYPKFQLNGEEIKYILEEELLPYAETIKITSKINNIVEKIQQTISLSHLQLMEMQNILSVGISIY
jgi:hypothetical protein